MPTTLLAFQAFVAIILKHSFTSRFCQSVFHRLKLYKVARYQSPGVVAREKRAPMIVLSEDVEDLVDSPVRPAMSGENRMHAGMHCVWGRVTGLGKNRRTKMMRGKRRGKEE